MSVLVPLLGDKRTLAGAASRFMSTLPNTPISLRDLGAATRATDQSGVLSISPFERTNQCSLANGLPASRSASQSARAADALEVDLGASGEPVDQRFADRSPILHREIQAEHRRLVLAGSVDRQHRHPAVEEAIAIERNLDLLEAVHSGDCDHCRNAAAAVARRQMEPGRNRLVVNGTQTGSTRWSAKAAYLAKHSRFLLL